ncbi:hypothetical protein BO94DRAFT_283233 [Aspergillus sclerotioniger CBS 115572]|uniref:Secreted protein n=1 Tax=Aspergillus sclerotioniger CBS 115572 TaxID=1450535 RepID=A0A317X883_9EURO|nr:hypothetical protein BO94DRAFT_283233 [Aspergillus sclerotioniger CBS 115572]PWY94739.1 hypothetical protein BO94DRAFT_283233 [Aspergillus sclerotioniger CBS 115572]
MYLWRCLLPGLVIEKATCICCHCESYAVQRNPCSLSSSLLAIERGKVGRSLIQPPGATVTHSRGLRTSHDQRANFTLCCITTAYYISQFPALSSNAAPHPIGGFGRAISLITPGAASHGDCISRTV